MAERSNNFDALRLVAAVSVIFSHAFLLSEGSEQNEPLMRLTGGQTILGVVGVFVFFVISGFLVTQSFEQTGSPWRFLAKRALRIYPGLAVCVLVLGFVLGPAVTSLPLRDYLRDSGVYDFVGANLVLAVEHNSLPGVRFTGYDIGTNINGPFWSLPCEVVMYLLVLALGSLRLIRLGLLLPLLGLGLVCILCDTTATGYFIGDVGWLLGYFVAGMIGYRLHRTRHFLDRRVALLALLGLIASTKLHVLLLLFPIFGGYLTLYLALSPALPPLRAARVGDLSYGLYIYGWPVEQALLYAGDGALPWWALFLLATIATAAIAFLSWHVIEQPALRLKPGRALPRVTHGSAAGAVGKSA